MSCVARSVIPLASIEDTSCPASLHDALAEQSARLFLFILITAKPCMESTAGGMESRAKGTKRYTLSRDDMRGRAAIPYNSHGELMPCQALRSWINKKTNRSSSFYFGGASFSKVEPTLKSLFLDQSL